VAFSNFAPIPWGSVAQAAESTAIGAMIGLERRTVGKRAGVRICAMVSLAATLAWWQSPRVAYALLISLIPILTALNVLSLVTDQSLEMTTSIAILTTALLGILVAQGLWLIVLICGVIVTALLAWKGELTEFAKAVTIQEIRGALIVGIIGVVIYPLLPAGPVDPWGLVNLRDAWVGVLGISGIGFLNYIVLRLWGVRGIAWTGVLGGFVNSRAVAVELAAWARADPSRMWPFAIFGILTANLAMLLRNALILAAIAPAAFPWAGLSLGCMLAVAAVLAVVYHSRTAEPARLDLGPPVSLRHVLTFGLVFLVIATAGEAAERFLGHAGFLLVTVAGGLVSSASSVVAAAALAAQGKVQPDIAAYAVIVASMTTLLSNIPTVQLVGKDRNVTNRLLLWSVLTVAGGIVGLVAESLVHGYARPL
jgi:uncharacterized membrane protein (DUF4010 family)